MVISTEQALGHFRRIHLGGEIGEVVLTGQLCATATTVNQDLLLVTPDLEEAEPLPQPVGVLDLKRLIMAIERYSYDGGYVSLTFETAKRRIIVATPQSGAVYFETADPNVICTSIAQENRDAILSTLPDAELGAWLSKAVIDGVLDSSRVLSADVIGLEVRPGASRFVVVGSGNFAVVPYPDLESEEQYWLWFDAKLLTAVLRQIEDYAQSLVQVTGPDSVVAIREADYLYVLSPCEYLEGSGKALQRFEVE